MKLKLKINSNLDDNDSFVVKKDGNMFILELGTNVEIVFEDSKISSKSNKSLATNTTSPSGAKLLDNMNSFNKVKYEENKSSISGEVIDDRDKRIISLSNAIMEKISQMSYNIFFEDAVEKSYIKNSTWILNFNEEELHIVKKKYIGLLEEIAKKRDLKISLNSNNKINI